MSDTDLQDRVAALETRAARIRPATEGADGWANFVESRILEESEFLQSVMAHALASFQNDILDRCKTAIAEALSQRVRGTFDAKEKYVSNDVVVCDGASFVAKRDNPGPCPGAGWQMIAKQGQRGIAGPRGEPGKDGTRIVGWVVDRATYSVTPLLAGGGPPGPTLDLRELFEQSKDNTAA
jgi:hypothetical protein